MTTAHSRSQSGFTLVEMAIVIVIVGLLVGGVTVGQNLIRNADLQTVITDATKYKAAAKQFKEKYMALPGDFSEATLQWGKDNTNCSGHTGTAATPGTCNGNGNGDIQLPAVAGQTGETLQFWKQLQLAGYIQGTFSGLGGSGSLWDNTPGINSPKGKIANSGWSVFWSNSAGTGVWGDAQWFNIFHGNTLTFGTKVTNDMNYGNVLTPKEAWKIDGKIDDGKPGTGDVGSFWSGGCTSATANNQNLTAVYDLDNTAVVCRLEFPRAFE